MLKDPASKRLPVRPGGEGNMIMGSERGGETFYIRMPSGRIRVQPSFDRLVFRLPAAGVVVTAAQVVLTPMGSSQGKVRSALATSW